jgi:hypothetical protein
MPAETPLVAVDIPMVGDERHKNWAKVVYSVDPTKSSGWAFVGDFIASGGIQDVPAGAVVVVYGERGSRSNPQIEARVFQANADATLSHHQTARGRAWARTIRDTVQDLLDESPDAVHDLSWIPDQLLLEEARRRGLV